MAGIIGRFIRRSRAITGPTCLLRPGKQAVELLTQEGALKDMEPPVVASLEPVLPLLSSDVASVQTRVVS